ncbi:hemiasterlin resistant protein 1-like [Panicum virgatum]|uniref:hemiasterlin resistant protein 1-like n=1 Tax=Panicum virgatum TaxID=38727 RepID=UPI0019D4FCF0|nr:hemiasterlin resistant protein 1-like [Panicum virgatum]
MPFPPRRTTPLPQAARSYRPPPLPPAAVAPAYATTRSESGRDSPCRPWEAGPAGRRRSATRPLVAVAAAAAPAYAVARSGSGRDSPSRLREAGPTGRHRPATRPLPAGGHDSPADHRPCLGRK